MAALNCVVQTAEIALTAATARTVLQILAAANQRVRVMRWGVFFDGVSVTAEPVQVVLMRQTSAGSGSSSATPVKLDSAIGTTIQTTAISGPTGEPTASDILDVIEVHPQQGYEVVFPLGQEIIVGGGGRLGIQCTAPAGVNVRAKIVFEE